MTASKGFGSSDSIDSNATVDDRETPRRVEFAINFLIQNTENTQ